MVRRLPPGLYEALVSTGLGDALDGAPGADVVIRDPLDAAGAHEHLARYFAGELERILRAMPKEGGPEKQAELVNELLDVLKSKTDATALEGASLLVPPEVLLAIHPPPAPPPRPTVPLSVSTLLTHAKNEPRLGAEIASEIESADAVDMLVSFIKWHGWRRLKDAFEVFARAGKKLRVLTTTYMGATDREALDAIAGLPGAQVRVSFDARRTRLHAKAWLFHRATGFSSAYVGSANVSSAALSEGLEWNLKASEAESRAIVEKFRGAFESLWEDGEFEPYHPDDADAARRLAQALSSERGGGRAGKGFFFDLRPYEYQRAILEKLRVEREEHGRWKNLVVAATGTGKTMIAAFDYAAQVRGGVRPRLLFVAHREEILEQALDAFRNVLRDRSFGEILKGGVVPESYEHLFATIQSLDRKDLVAALGPEYWHTVIVDEFHHAAAKTYGKLLGTVRPEILLGLTATPERADGLDVLGWFDHHVAADIRLWHALEKQILAPFEYYGVADGVSLEAVEWRRGGYDLAGLDKLYSGNDERARLVVSKLREIHGHPEKARGLGFCVSVAHAEFMARKFTEAGIPSLAIHGTTGEDDRDDAPRKLERGDIAFLFTCDLYNEGVDLPFVDTLMLLRPTESATLFLQQLGRGLRLHPGKAQALVLDFIGQQRAEYRFDRKLTAMTGIPRGRLRQAVEEGFPTLPSGCHLQLERVARKIVVENLRQAIRGGRARLAQELNDLARQRGPHVTLAEFLEATGRELGDVYADGVRGWTTLRRAAGLLPGKGTDQEAQTSRRMRKLGHVDEPARLRLYRQLAMSPSTDVRSLEERDRRRLAMLALRLFDGVAPSLAALIEPLLTSAPLCEELVQLCEVLDDRIAVVSQVADVPPEWPLAVHRTYARDEILAAVGESTVEKRVFSREGLHRVRDRKAQLFFVTIDKSSRGRFSPTTSYEDYAISPTLFHWQSQSTTSEQSPTGLAYVKGHTQGWRFYLFARPTVEDQFTFLGPVRYRSHQGSRPITITWELEVPIPPAFLETYATLRVG
jgi:superfamily II DNA or RNA helicase/HKD family nuclease